jgi:hypothetical protein
MSYENPWLYHGLPLETEQTDGYIGFVYLITNLVNDKKYVGKKLFKFSRTKQVKGKKKRVKIDSDWKDYYGSNVELNEDVKNQGPHNFKREVLRLCKSKGECNYQEAKSQFERLVLERDDYYNGWISVKVHKSHINKNK